MQVLPAKQVYGSQSIKKGDGEQHSQRDLKKDSRKNGSRNGTRNFENKNNGKFGDKDEAIRENNLVKKEEQEKEIANLKERLSFLEKHMKKVKEKI